MPHFRGIFCLCRVARFTGWGVSCTSMTPKLLLLLLFCTLTVACPAQTTHKHPPAATPATPSTPASTPAPLPTDKIKVDKISYTGTGAADYSPTDFAAVTGLAPGMVLYGDIQIAADKLANSG